MDTTPLLEHSGRGIPGGQVMREYLVRLTGGTSVIIYAASPLEAERLAKRDGHRPLNIPPTPVGEPEDGNEFEGMTPRELRNLIRTTQADLRKAVTDRSALLRVVKRLLESPVCHCDTSPDDNSGDIPPSGNAKNWYGEPVWADEVCDYCVARITVDQAEGKG